MKAYRIFVCLVIIGLLFNASLDARDVGIVVFPPDKSQVAEAEILFILKKDSPFKPGSVDLSLNNEKLSNDVNYLQNLAYVTVSLQKGENELVIYHDNQLNQELSYLFQEEEQPVTEGYTFFRLHNGFVNSECRDCHNLKDQPLDFKTLRDSEEALTICLECHDDRLQAKYIHGPVGMGACNPCHEHHGSTKASLLKDNGNDLCHNCHERERTNTHLDKLQKAKADCATKCLTCHDSHGTEKKFHLK